MTGPPGSGKTLLARSRPSILPTMSVEEALEVTKIYYVHLGDEPVPLRLLWRPGARMHVLDAADRRSASAATRSASPGRCWTALTSTSRCHV